MNLSKLTLSLAFALCSGSAWAATDCSTVSVNGNGYVAYSDQEVFPNPAKKTQMELSQVAKPTKVSVCDVKITADSNAYSYQSQDIATLSRIFGGYGMGWTFDLLDKVKQNGKTGYKQAATLHMDLPDGMLNTEVKISGAFTGDLSAQSVMAVRFNGGKLLPLLFNNRFREIKLDPKTAKKIDIYIRSPNALVWTRMSMDIVNNKMTFYKSAPFPSK